MIKQKKKILELKKINHGIQRTKPADLFPSTKPILKLVMVFYGI
jgi:hypothetical protein